MNIRSLIGLLSALSLTSCTSYLEGIKGSLGEIETKYFESNAPAKLSCDAHAQSQGSFTWYANDTDLEEWCATNKTGWQCSNTGQNNITMYAPDRTRIEPLIVYCTDETNSIIKMVELVQDNYLPNMIGGSAAWTECPLRDGFHLILSCKGITDCDTNTWWYTHDRQALNDLRINNEFLILGYDVAAAAGRYQCSCHSEKGSKPLMKFDVQPASTDIQYRSKLFCGYADIDLLAEEKSTTAVLPTKSMTTVAIDAITTELDEVTTVTHRPTTTTTTPPTTPKTTSKTTTTSQPTSSTQELSTSTKASSEVNINVDHKITAKRLGDDVQQPTDEPHDKIFYILIPIIGFLAVCMIIVPLLVYLYMRKRNRGGDSPNTPPHKNEDIELSELGHLTTSVSKIGEDSRNKSTSLLYQEEAQR